MARLTKTEAARQLGIARATLYKLIAQGQVSPTPDGLIDQAELVRVAPYIDTLHERSRTPTDSRERLQTSKDRPPAYTQDPQEYRERYRATDVHERLQTGVHGRPQTGVYERPQTSTDTPGDVHRRSQTSPDFLIDLLQDQLRVMQDREREVARLYEAREQAYREHIAQLTTMLHEAHQQNQRLLDLPRGMPPTAGPQRPQDNRATPAYDPARYRLGSLCVRGHNYAGTGQTLRRIPNGACPQCETEAQRERREQREGSQNPIF